MTPVLLIDFGSTYTKVTAIAVSYTHLLQGILAYAAHQQIPFVEVIQQKPLDQVEAHHMAGRGHMGSGAGTGVKLTANGNVAFVHIVNGLSLIHI